MDRVGGNGRLSVSLTTSKDQEVSFEVQGKDIYKLAGSIVDHAAGLWHLGVGDEYQGTYCTRMNPLARIDLAGVKLHYRNGGYLIVPRDGAEVSTFMPHQIARLRPMTYHHQTPEVCPDCLSMAVVTAEMNGQNTYPVKRPLNALEGTNTPTRK